MRQRGHRWGKGGHTPVDEIDVEADDALRFNMAPGSTLVWDGSEFISEAA